MTDYSLYEVILNGDSPIPTRVINGVVQPVAPTIADQRLARKNELKAQGTLLMTLPDKHQLKFNIHKDAKTLMKAIEKWFCGNKETKKVQKTLLKQQYENFIGSSSESLDQIHDRLQKLIISAVASVSAASTIVPVSALPNVDTLNADDLEEMGLKWKMAMLIMRERRIQGIKRLKGGMYQWRLLLLMHWFYNVMVLEAMIGAFRQKKNQPTMPSWHSHPQVLP
nr:hypothetical protein [Tanacetum cinerariifolium]